MFKNIATIVVIPSIIALAGCSAIPLKKQAGSVLVSMHTPASDCQFLGQVHGQQGNFFTGDFTSNENLENGAMNDLRNQAIDLGANYVSLITDRASSTMSGYSGQYGGGMSGDQTGVYLSGNAYKCP
jgi:hypothetical protein